MERHLRIAELKNNSLKETIELSAYPKKVRIFPRLCSDALSRVRRIRRSSRVAAGEELC